MNKEYKLIYEQEISLWTPIIFMVFSLFLSYACIKMYEVIPFGLTEVSEFIAMSQILFVLILFANVLSIGYTVYYSYKYSEQEEYGVIPKETYYFNGKFLELQEKFALKEQKVKPIKYNTILEIKR